MSACACPPCPGRGSDGHGQTHCAECCFGSGVEADMACPRHGIDAPTPERVRLTDEPAFIAEIRRRPNGVIEHHPLQHAREDEESAEAHAGEFIKALDDWLAAREQALREEIATGCQHANVETFRTHPPHAKCLDCGQRVEERWVTQGGDR